MHRLPTRLLGPALALAFLFPPLATAQPQQEAVRSPAERTTAAPSLFAELRSLLSILWAETGSGLEPNGGADSGTEPGGATSGDTGSGLDPNG